MNTNYQDLGTISIDKLSDYNNDLPESANAHVLDLGGDKIYFSYSTIVATRINNELTISENNWSNTTGRHLNTISPDHSIRIPTEQFNQHLIDIKIKLYVPDNS